MALLRKQNLAKDVYKDVRNAELIRKFESIEIKDGVITIKGEKNKETVEGESCHCSERYSGAFQRDFRIGGKIDKDNIDASFKDGVLKLTLPKSEESVPKRIEIH